MDYVEGAVDDDNNGEKYIHMDEENTTGLNIAQVISMEDQKEDEPMDIESENFIVPPIHHVEVLEKEIVVVSSQVTQGGNTTDQQKDVPPLDTTIGGATTDDTPIPAPLPKSTPVEEIPPQPMAPPPGPKPESSDITPEPQPPVPPESKETELDQNKNVQNPNPQTLESDNKKDPNGEPTPANI